MREILREACEEVRAVFRERRFREPLTPKAVRTTLYLNLRSCIQRAVRRVVRRHFKNQYQRQYAYHILFKALRDIFLFGWREDIISVYEQMWGETVECLAGLGG